MIEQFAEALAASDVDLACDGEVLRLLHIAGWQYRDYGPVCRNVNDWKIMIALARHRRSHRRRAALKVVRS